MPYPRQQPSGQDGFTLIEIMVVVVILGILAALVVPNIMGSPGEARVTAAKAEIRTIEQQLGFYRVDNFQYPTTEQGLEALVTRPSTQPEPKNWRPGGYLKRVPKDPWDNIYHYRNPGEHGEIDVYSLGRDNRPGGEGEDADIGNWDLQS